METLNSRICSSGKIYGMRSSHARVNQLCGPLRDRLLPLGTKQELVHRTVGVLDSGRSGKALYARAVCDLLSGLAEG